MVRQNKKLELPTVLKNCLDSFLFRKIKGILLTMGLPLREREYTVSKVMFTSSPCSGWELPDCKTVIMCEHGNAKTTQADLELPSIPFK